MRLTRFERKIVTAMAAVAFLPLFGSLVLGGLALLDTYRIGVNPRVQTQLERGLEVYRSHFVALRDDAERTADAIAFDHRLHDAIARDDRIGVERFAERAVDRYPHVARVVVIRDGALLAEVVDPQRHDRSVNRLLEQERALEGLPGQPMVRVTIAAPASAFLEFQRAGEVAQDYARLEESAELISGLYLGVYILLLLSVIAVALAFGIVLSRRVTRRVALLAEATGKVGSGDLTVEVPADARDEVGELTLAFNEMVKDLRESRERIDYLSRIGAWQEFARRLAHEIKNPLTPIQLAAQEVHQGYKGEDDAYRRKLDDARSIIEEEVATLRRLVGEFSSFAKLPQAELSEADLNDFVQDLDKSLGAVAEGEELLEDVVITVEPAEGVLPVRIDAMMLKRCVDNLVRNSVHAMRDAEVGGEVVVRAYEARGEAVLEVADAGPGVDDDAKARIFDPYYTTKHDGTGLGLAIVKKVVLEHGGRIECDDSDLGGATFRIRLPVAR